jgi:hypothetical protein
MFLLVAVRALENNVLNKKASETWLSPHPRNTKNVMPPLKSQSHLQHYSTWCLKRMAAEISTQ